MIIQLLSKYIRIIYTQWKNIYIYIHDSDKFIERIPFSGLKKKNPKRSTRVRRTTFVVGKYSFVDPPIKLAFRRFWSRFEKFGIVVSRGGERKGRLASFCHTHQPFRETDGFETVVNGWERGGGASVERGYPCVKNSCRRCRKLSL